MAAYAIAWKCMQALRRDGNLPDALCKYYVPVYASPTSGCTLAWPPMEVSRLHFALQHVEPALQPRNLHWKIC